MRREYPPLTPRHARAPRRLRPCWPVIAGVALSIGGMVLAVRMPPLSGWTILAGILIVAGHVSVRIGTAPRRAREARTR